MARTSLSATQDDLGKLLKQVKANLSVPIVAVVSDGQRSIRNAVETALPEAVHGLCHFHYLREAVKPIYEADRHAKKELKKRVRGIRAIERSVQNSEDALNQVVEGYAHAVRSALTDDGHPPLETPGVKLQRRLSAIEQSIERVAQKGGHQSH